MNCLKLFAVREAKKHGVGAIWTILANDIYDVKCKYPDAEDITEMPDFKGTLVINGCVTED
jgi:hypothetical protein